MIRCNTLPNSRNSSGTLESAAIFCVPTKDLTGFTESPTGGETRGGNLSGLAIETFRKAREIAPHAGVVKSVLRLFDELVKCDEEGVLKDVREVIEIRDSKE